MNFGVPRALLLLLFLRGKGWLRRSFSTASPQRLFMSIVGLSAFALWAASFILPSLLASGRSARPRPSAENILTAGGVLAFCFTAIPMVAGGVTKWLAFSPAELDHVVPGPFSRRHLLTYKILSIATGSLVSAFIFSIVARPQAPFWPLQFIAGFLLMLFTGMLTVCFALVSEVAWRRRIPLRLGMGLFVIAVAARGFSVAISAGGRGENFIQAVLTDPSIAAVGIPFRPFLHVFAAGAVSVEVAIWLTASIGLVAVAYFLLMNLDAVAIERSVRSAYEAAQKAEAKPHAGGPTRIWRGSSAFVPALEFLGPPRAIVRKHLQTSFATLVVLPLLLIVGGGLGGWLVLSMREPTPLPSIMLSCIAIWLCAFCRIDFRADLDHLSTLKALPLSSRAVTLSQLAPVWLSVSLGHAVGASILFITDVCSTSVLSENPTIALQIALLLLTAPAAALVIAFENLFFLHFPSRPMPKGAFNFGLTGRVVVLMLGRLAAFLLIASVCAPLTGVTYYTLGLWPAAGVLAMHVVVVAMVLVLLAARAFARFDVAVDMPDDPR